MADGPVTGARATLRARPGYERVRFKRLGLAQGRRVHLTRCRQARRRQVVGYGQVELERRLFRLIRPSGRRLEGRSIGRRGPVHRLAPLPPRLLRRGTKTSARAGHLDRRLGGAVKGVAACFGRRALVNHVCEHGLGRENGEVDLIHRLPTLSAFRSWQVFIFRHLPIGSAQLVNAIWHRDMKFPP